MNSCNRRLLIFIGLSICLTICCCQSSASTKKMPTVLIVTLFRNKEHTMPYYFSYLERLSYPKDRISLWFRSDYNEDKTIEVLLNWLYKYSNLYHKVNIEYHNTSSVRRPSEETGSHWSIERYEDVIDMKEEALKYGREIWADYIFFLDADVFLTFPATLETLIDINQPVVGPVLQSDGLYSNFWCGMTDDYYYHRTDEYKEIYYSTKSGDFPVPMVHSAVLIDLNDARNDILTFNRTTLAVSMSLSDQDVNGMPIDDIIMLSISANRSESGMLVSNKEKFGYVTVPLEQGDGLTVDMIHLTNTLQLMISHLETGLTVLPEMETFIKYPKPDMMSLSNIYMINLVRRPERRLKMEQNFKVMGIDSVYVPAIDGAELTDENLKVFGVEILTGYADPYHGRPMTLGEIGCFLSHYFVWERIVLNDESEVLILEDDIQFEPFFKDRVQNLLNEAREHPGWDLIYLGRKRLEDHEHYIENSEQIVTAGYSYWTLGYIITKVGAKKLIDAKPLSKIIPVDEFLPIMFDRHGNDSWKQHFSNRNLIAWSASPLLLFPTHYTGDDGYISDTEDSLLVSLDVDTKEKKGNKEREYGHIESKFQVEDTIQLAGLMDSLDVKGIHSEL